MAAATGLSDLFLALFDTQDSLRRFLSLAGFKSVERGLRRSKGGSARLSALQAAEDLERQELVDRLLFDQLVEVAPDRADDIWHTAEHYGISPEDVELRGSLGSKAVDRPRKSLDDPDQQDFDDIPEKYRDFLKDLDVALESAAVEVPADEAFEERNWPWTGAAAVLGEFNPTELKPLPGDDPSSSAVDALVDVVYSSLTGTWVLDEEVRRQALARLVAEDLIAVAVEVNNRIPDRRRDWIRRLLVEGESTALTTLKTDDLEDLDVVIDWLEPLDFAIPESRAAVAAAIERRLLIDPLRALVGRHFRGRRKELRLLRKHIRGTKTETILTIRGPGGVGKSSLLGKILLELEAKIADDPVPFAYVDFDKARHNPRSPRDLIEQIARQLRLLYAASAEASNEFATLEALGAGESDFEFAAQLLEFDTSESLDTGKLISELAMRLERIRRPAPGQAQLILVFDTFEEVQVLGPGAVGDFFELVGQLRDAMPDIRLIISGRGKIINPNTSWFRPPIELGDLDAVAADSALKARGVKSRSVRRLIFENFGGNPLTLLLAADAFRRTRSVDLAFGDVANEADLIAEMAKEQIQGMLYSRILGHLDDPNVLAIAHPGLAVRRVDVDVIRQVLADPCGLDPNDAPAVFEQLRREVSLFDAEPDGGMRHRQDVRRLMMQTIMDDPERADTVRAIHRAAIEYYGPMPGPVAAAEEIYHRLMIGEDPRTFARPWTAPLGDSLASALEEPLPPNARVWLNRQMGRAGSVDDVSQDPDDRDEWEQIDWEIDAATRVRSWLASGRPGKALDVLSEREFRLRGSDLYALEVEALIGAGRLEDAGRLLDNGMRSAIDAGDRGQQLQLAGSRMHLATATGDGPGVVDATMKYLRLADFENQEIAGTDRLVSTTEAMRDEGFEAETGDLAAELADRFDDLPVQTLVERPDLVRRILHVAGPTESSVLMRAAVEMGDTSSDRDPIFRDDSFALGRLLEQVGPSGERAMEQLAQEVGLREDTWTLRELATMATRQGRMGIAVAVGLDHATEISAARKLVVDDLVVQPYVAK